MKAKDYLDKYGARMHDAVYKSLPTIRITEDEKVSVLDTEQATDEACFTLFKDFVAEMADMIKARHAKRLEALIAILRELNRKWNTFIDLYQKAFSETCPMARDGFWYTVLHQMPALDAYCKANNITTKPRKE